MSEQTTQLSATELRVIELDREKAAHSKFYEEYNAAIEELAAEKGIGHAFQDEDGIVYQTVNPKGTFIEYRTVGIERTRRVGETRGSLSLKAAQELGFEPFAGPFTAPENSQEVSA